MADTARTLTALKALLPDNTSGDITPQDLRDVLVSCLGEWGFQYKMGAANITPGNAYVRLSPAAPTAIGTITDDSSFGFNVERDGAYLVFLKLDIGAASVTDAVYALIKVGSTASSWFSQRYMPQTGGGPVILAGVIEVSGASVGAPVVVSVEWKTASGGIQLTLDTSLFGIKRLA